VPDKTVSSIDDSVANTVTLVTADTTIVAGKTFQLTDRSGTTAATIAAAAVASIDAGAANTVTLPAADATIVAGQTLRLADAAGQTCLATPKDSDLVVASVNGDVVTFTTDLTLGDASASTTCVVARAAPCAATPKGSDLIVSGVVGSVVTFTTDITAGDASAADNCILTQTVCTSCANNVLDGLETGVDCGGATCAQLCPTGTACDVDGDCVTNKCDSGTSTCRVLTGGETAAILCANSAQDNVETGVDCGGAICRLGDYLCASGGSCLANEDCTTGLCTFGVCVSCSDSTRNGDETGLDCGGAVCDSCGDGLACTAATDCGSGQCDAVLSLTASIMLARTV
jgi:hypothetical protein